MNLWEQHKAERRGRILEAARKLITHGGVEALSMRQLAREASLSVATLYNLHGSKADILYALLEQAIEAVDHTLDRIPTEDPLAYAEFIENMATEQIIADKQFYRPLMHAIVTSIDLERDPIVGHRILSDYERMLDAGVASGFLLNRPETHLVARQMYLSLMHAVQYWSIRLMDDAALRTQCQYTIVICLLSVGTEQVRPVLLKRLGELSAKLADVFPTAATKSGVARVGVR